MADSSGKNILKYGCLGCLGLILLAVIGIGVIVGVARMQASGEQVEEHSLRADLPVTDLPVAGAEGDGTIQTPTGALPAGRGRIELDLSGTGFRIDPAAPDQGFEVLADYDERHYRMEETLDTGEDGSWVYRLSFQRIGSGWIAGLRQAMGGSSPTVKIYIPTDVRVDLEIDVSEGAVEAELGGLWLTSLDLDVSRGAGQISIGEPLREPIEFLKLNGSMGGFDTRTLGNASPRRVDVDCQMGGMELDLKGAWRNDAEIEIDAKMSGGIILLPEGVRFEGLDRSGVGVAPDAELQPPVLLFDVNVDRDAFEFID